MKTLWLQTFWKILVKAWGTLLGPHNQNFGWYGVTRPQIEATAEDFFQLKEAIPFRRLGSR